MTFKMIINMIQGEYVAVHLDKIKLKHPLFNIVTRKWKISLAGTSSVIHPKFDVLWSVGAQLTWYDPVTSVEEWVMHSGRTGLEGANTSLRLGRHGKGRAALDTLGRVRSWAPNFCSRGDQNTINIMMEVPVLQELLMVQTLLTFWWK